MNKKNVDLLLYGAGDLVKGGRNQPGYKKKMFPSENSQAMELIAERGWAGSILGSFEGG